MAKSLGLESLASLKEILKTNLQQQYGQASRFKLKRALLDYAGREAQLRPAAKRMVEAEFDGIWQQVEQDKANGQLAAGRRREVRTRN